MISKTVLIMLFSGPLLFAPISAFAGSRADGALTTEMKERTFRATLKSGFHFNESAPNALVLDGKTIKPSKLKGREGEFTDLPKEWSTGRASLYICDDAVTFCEPHFVDLKGTPAAPKTEVSSAKSEKGRVNHHGFIEDDLSQALEEAKKTRRLILVYFAARWCPGCVRFETEVFDNPKFKEIAQGFTKLKIDVDRFENGVLSKKFKAQGIPTLLVINAAQEEVDRMTGFQTISTLEGFFSAVQADPISLQALTEKAKSKDPKVILRLGKRLVAAGRYQDSLPYLSQVQPLPPEYWTAKVGAVADQYKADPTSKAQFATVLKEAITAEAGSLRSIAWRQSLVEIIDDAAEVKKLRADGVKLADALLSNPEQMKEAAKYDSVGEFVGYEPLLVAMERAQLIETSKAGAQEISQAWKKAADTGRKLQISSKNVGPSMRYLIVLTKAEQFKDADKVVSTLLKQEPHNPEYQRRRLRVLLGLKKYPEAIELGQACLKSSYGQNEFWVAEVLAKTYIGAGRMKDAKALLDRYLNRDDIEWSSLQSSRKTLQELRATAEKSI